MYTLIKKEVLSGIRNYKFLIIGFALIFFAILDPVMNKYILPEILKSQFNDLPAEMLASMVDMSHKGSLLSYYNDIYEICFIVISFTLAGLIAKELSEKTLIIPLSSGKSISKVVLAKIIVYGLFSMVISVFSLLINYLYSTVLFENQVNNIMVILKNGVLFGLLIIFITSLILLIGSFSKKPIVTGLVTIGFIYVQGIFGSMLKIEKFLPNGLYLEIQKLSPSIESDGVISVVILILATIAFTYGTIYRLKTMEIGKR